MNKDYRMYILVNQDIKINKGKLAGQVGHAVATYMHKEHNQKLINEYMKYHNKKIFLYTNQQTLETLEDLGFVAIRDKGWTDLEPNTLTCVNLGILDYKEIPKPLNWIKKLKLVR